MIQQLDLFKSDTDTLFEMMTNLKGQMDSMRRKLFAEIDELKKENEFLSLQLELMHEKELQTH